MTPPTTALIARLSLSLWLLLVSLSAAAQPVFRAGAATSNITPPLGEPIVGNFVTPPAERVHDELHARCLVLDDGKARLAIVVCDNVGVSSEVFDRAKRLVVESTKIPLDHMLMSSTHTHSATSARSINSVNPDAELNDYQTFVARRIADGVRRAVANLAPAQIGWGSADVPTQVFNRRYHMKPGTELLNPLGGTDQVKMNPGIANPNVLKPAGPTDPQVSFITVKSTDGRPIALLANYSLHYVGGVPTGDVSADYFAAFADKVQQKLNADRLDPPFVGIMTNGTSGDVNNVDVLGPKRGKQKPYEQTDKVATEIADAVIKAHADVKFHDHVPLRAATRELTLKVRKPTPEMVDRAKRILSGEITPPGTLNEPYARRTLQLAESPDEVTVPLQAIAIGDLGIAAIPFEVFTATGLEIKAKSPLKPAFTISLANGSYGYLPTPEQHALGGYETWLGTNRVEVEASTKITAAILDLLARLKQ
ncbi:MAG: hypothetical protein ACAI43_12520 [Phycisphaerae bacterium]